MIPKSIIIFGIKFKIEVADLTNEDLAGDSNIDKKLIRINSKDKISNQRSTLLHEVIHMALEIGGIGSTLDEKVEEGIVRCIENSLHQLVEFK